MKITYATIVEREQGPDKVCLWTDLPEAKFPYRDRLTLDFDCAKGTARRYLAEHFPDLEVQVYPAMRLGPPVGTGIVLEVQKPDGEWVEVPKVKK